MKLILALFVSLSATSAFAAKLSATKFTCTSVKAGLVVTTIPQNFLVEVFDLQGNLLNAYTDVYPVYSYADVLNPMFIDVKIIDGFSGKTILLASEQAGKITGEFNGDASFVCQKQ
ncbi:MAG: hypothetical protein HUU57_10375 [Bdellovibrio sp.]|nr:hypothetical protein [Bdellovibrio sp.]